jgi:hypothetical protein
MDRALLAKFPIERIRVFWDRDQGKKAQHQGLWIGVWRGRGPSSPVRRSCNLFGPRIAEKKTDLRKAA